LCNFIQVFDILSERAKTEAAFGHLPTGLGALDEYLWGGIPFGVLTEIVGHAGIGKTQVDLQTCTYQMAWYDHANSVLLWIERLSRSA
jgi:RecA/RadA recombinase